MPVWQVTNLKFHQVNLLTRDFVRFVEKQIRAYIFGPPCLFCLITRLYSSYGPSRSFGVVFDRPYVQRKSTQSHLRMSFNSHTRLFVWHTLRPCNQVYDVSERQTKRVPAFAYTFHRRPYWLYRRMLNGIDGTSQLPRCFCCCCCCWCYYPPQIQ